MGNLLKIGEAGPQKGKAQAGRGDIPATRAAEALRPRSYFFLLLFFLAVLGLVGSILVLVPTGPLRADGGTLRISNAPMGAYRVNVFTDPTPVPPDTIDVSILATFERGRGVALGLEILVTGRRLDGVGPEVSKSATRDQAEDPRYYSAKFALGSVGDWEIQVSLVGPEGEGSVSFQISVQESGPFGNPVLLLGLAFLPLLLVGWWLRKSSPSSRPEG